MASVVVTCYFTNLLFSRQFLETPDEFIFTDREPKSWMQFGNATLGFSVIDKLENMCPDVYIPFFTIIEFLCIFGWIKVAETLLNPFGDDDEDFDCNYLIDRNLQVCERVAVFENIYWIS